MKTGVVGAGLMGTEIAYVFALAGFDVVLCDLDKDALGRAEIRIGKLLDRRIGLAAGMDSARDDVLARIEFSSAMSSMDRCGMVTEAVFEDLKVKADVLRELDEICPPDCIIASNTSTLPISTLASGLRVSRRSKFIGTHYFSPVSRMELVEVIPAFETADQTTSETFDVMRTIGKTPVLIKDVAGFAVNRLLHAMLIEAVNLIDEGVAKPEDIDTACRLGLGHPIGPFALMDAVSSSLVLQVQEILHSAYGERFRPPPLLKQRVAAGLGGGRRRKGWLTQSGDV